MRGGDDDLNDNALAERSFETFVEDSMGHSGSWRENGDEEKFKVNELDKSRVGPDDANRTRDARCGHCRVWPRESGGAALEQDSLDRSSIGAGKDADWLEA